MHRADSHTGAPWADIPARYGPHTTCVNRFNRWRKRGIWARLLGSSVRGLRRRHPDDRLVVDRVHQHAANTQKKTSDPVAWVARAAA